MDPDITGIQIEEESKEVANQVQTHEWIEISGLSDVSEGDKENVNVLNQDSSLCEKLLFDASTFLQGK